MSEAAAIIVFGLLSGLMVWVAWRRGFFVFDPQPWEVPVRFAHVAVAFAIYFASTFLSSYFFLFLQNKGIFKSTISLASWFNFSASSFVLIGFIILLLILPKKIRSGIWRRPTNAPKTVFQDIWVALFAWAVAFPLVLFLSQLLELFLSFFFNIEQLPDQVAVKFLKMTFEHPLYFILSVFSIVVLAPLIEETLFRGFLQTFIRQHLGSKQAIWITSACFSFFHYSSEQGMGNIPIIGSLFVLALFLGYLYERQRTLMAPMALHASFNAISVMNIYFLGGYAGGI